MIELAVLAALTASFAPPLDKPLRYITTETRTIGAKRFSFETTRHVTFQRNGDGYLALLTIDIVDGEAGSGIAAIVGAAMKGFAGRSIRYHLDTAGKVVAIDDCAALFKTLQDAIGQLGKTAAQKARAARFAAALGNLPLDQQQAMIGSILESAIAGDAATAHPGDSGPIDVVANPAAGAPAQLKGTRSVHAAPHHRLDLHTEAAGDVSGKTGAAHVTLVRDAVIDPATGLIATLHETTVMTLGDQRSASETTTVIDLPVF